MSLGEGYPSSFQKLNSCSRGLPGCKGYSVQWDCLLVCSPTLPPCQTTQKSQQNGNNQCVESAILCTYDSTVKHYETGQDETQNLKKQPLKIHRQLSMHKYGYADLTVTHVLFKVNNLHNG